MVFRLTGDDTQIYLTKDNWEYPGEITEPDLSGYDRFITDIDPASGKENG